MGWRGGGARVGWRGVGGAARGGSGGVGEVLGGRRSRRRGWGGWLGGESGKWKQEEGTGEAARGEGGAILHAMGKGEPRGWGRGASLHGLWFQALRSMIASHRLQGLDLRTNSCRDGIAACGFKAFAAAEPSFMLLVGGLACCPR